MCYATIRGKALLVRVVHRLVLVALLLAACSSQDIKDAAQREAERQAQEAVERAKQQLGQWVENAKKDLEDALKQQSEQQKDEIIRKYVGIGAPPKAVNLFVQAYKKALPDIGTPLGEVTHWENTDTYTQDFLGAGGRTLFVLSADQHIVHALKNPWLQAYEEAGGPDVLGPPLNTVHEWNDGCTDIECRGQVQDFGAGENRTILMQREGTDDVFAVSGGGWFDTYLGMRASGMIGYPVANRKPYGEKTGWFGLGGFQQLGEKQLFITPTGPFALIVRKEKDSFISGIRYCTIASPLDITSDAYPCISDLKAPTSFAPIPTQPSKDDDQQFISYVRAYYMYDTLNEMLVRYGRPKGSKSLMFIQNAIREDYIYRQTQIFERAVSLREILETQWDDSYTPLAPDLFESLLNGKVHWEGYEEFFNKHPELRKTVAPVIEFATGLTPEGDLSNQDIALNVALLVIPFGKIAKPLLRPVEAILVRVGDSWIVRQGSKVIAKISGRVIPKVVLEKLPSEVKITLSKIRKGGPFPYKEDGTIFQNRERLLPNKTEGYYREYTVETPDISNRGERRIITGQGEEIYYTDDHYRSFMKVE